MTRIALAAALLVGYCADAFAPCRRPACTTTTTTTSGNRRRERPKPALQMFIEFQDRSYRDQDENYRDQADPYRDNFRGIHSHEIPWRSRMPNAANQDGMVQPEPILWQYAQNGNWHEVYTRVCSHPDEAVYDQNGWTPLHLMVAGNGTPAPLNVVRAVYSAFPKALNIRTVQYDRTPLDIAIHWNQPQEVIDFLSDPQILELQGGSDEYLELPGGAAGSSVHDNGRELPGSIDYENRLDPPGSSEYDGTINGDDGIIDLSPEGSDNGAELQVGSKEYDEPDHTIDFSPEGSDKKSDLRVDHSDYVEPIIDNDVSINNGLSEEGVHASTNQYDYQSFGYNSHPSTGNINDDYRASFGDNCIRPPPRTEYGVVKNTPRTCVVGTFEERPSRYVTPHQQYSAGSSGQGNDPAGTLAGNSNAYARTETKAATPDREYSKSSRNQRDGAAETLTGNPSMHTRTESESSTPEQQYSAGRPSSNQSNDHAGAPTTSDPSIYARTESEIVTPDRQYSEGSDQGNDPAGTLTTSDPTVYAGDVNSSLVADEPVPIDDDLVCVIVDDDALEEEMHNKKIMEEVRIQRYEDEMQQQRSEEAMRQRSQNRGQSQAEWANWGARNGHSWIKWTL